MNWIKVDSNTNYPSGVPVLVTDGKQVACVEFNKGSMAYVSGIQSRDWDWEFHQREITHFCIITLPETNCFHSTDWYGKCFKCGDQVFVREKN